MESRVRLAVVQAASVYMDTEKSIDKACALIAEAAANGAALVAFPEVWISGYPWWIWLGAPAWGARFLPLLHKAAISVDGPEIARVRAAATEGAIHVVLGFVERDGGSLYIAQVLIGPDGAILFKRRKLKPTHVERTVFGEGDGSDLKVIDTRIGRVGALCCAEHVQPLSKFAMYAMNEQIHIASWPSFTLYKDIAYGLSGQACYAASQVYALEGGCFVLHATSVLSQDVIDLLCETDEQRTWLGAAGGGLSAIFGPDGRPLTEPWDEDREGLLYADADFTQIVHAKSAYDPAGHYCRADATRLLLNTKPRLPVETLEPTEWTLPRTIEGDSEDQ